MVNDPRIISKEELKKVQKAIINITEVNEESVKILSDLIHDTAKQFRRGSEEELCPEKGE